MTPRRAYGQVRTALKNGVLSRPSRCERCNQPSPLGSDGRSTIHAHHHDYAKPLEIEWICVKCHRKETPLPIGERAFGHKLTEADARTILQSKEKTKILATRYGVCRTTIQAVRSGLCWGWLRTALAGGGL